MLATMSPAAAAMKTAWFLGLVVVWFCAVASIAAQENIRLHFEVYKNGKQVGAPAVTVKNSETGSVELGNMGNAKISFTPTRTDREKVRSRVCDCDRTKHIQTARHPIQGRIGLGLVEIRFRLI